MPRVCGACCGLLVFSAMILCGMLAGNAPQQTILRALLGLFGGLVLGSLSGWIAMFVIQENVSAEGAGEASVKKDDAAKSSDRPPDQAAPQT